MNHFHFRLQTITKLRLRQRDAAAESFRQAVEARNHLHQQTEKLQVEIAQQTSLQSQVTSGTIQTQRVLESQRYQLHLLSQINLIGEKIALIDQECQRRQQTLIQRETEVQALERLKETQYAQWQQLQTSQQQQAIDQWAGFQHWAGKRVHSQQGS